MNRLERITALLLQLQAHRVVRAPALAGHYGVSVRTIYRALLLHDRYDPNVPFPDAEEIPAHWPALDFRPTIGLGHTHIMRDPAVLRQVMEFLT